MSPADEELVKSIFGKQLQYEANQYKKMFDKHIESYYTDEEIRDFVRRESEYRIIQMNTIKGDVVKIKY